jgi:hypothetical protein
MIDEPALASVLESHFRTASRREIQEAVQDVLLLELLEADDVGVAWEDAMQDPEHACVTVFAGAGRHES